MPFMDAETTGAARLQVHQCIALCIHKFMGAKGVQAIGATGARSAKIT